MVVYHRKFLLPDALSPDSPPDDDDDGPESGNPSCYGCPPSPPPPPPPPPPPSKLQIPIILIVSICIFGAAFLLLLYFAIRRFRSRRRNSRPSENDTIRENTIDELHGPVIDHPIWYIRTVGLPQSVIDSIEVFKYRKGEGLIEGSDCTVCLSEFVEDETLRLLPKCSHAFHITCIDTWLRSHTNCPVCRAPVVIGGGIEVSSEGTSSINSESVGENDEEIEEEIEETIEGENGINGRVRVMSDLVDRRVKIDQQMEPVRRSVSEDFSYASTIYQIQLPERI